MVDPEKRSRTLAGQRFATDLSRNFLWMSPRSRHLVEQTHLVLVGCGGNGMMFTVYAAHLGFRRFTLCDADVLDATNLNRYLIATPEQVGEPKVEIVRAYLESRFPEVTVRSIQEHFPSSRSVAAFPTATLIVGCVDEVFPRVELDILARKYERPFMDLGSGFVADQSMRADDPIIWAGGQILVSRADGPCVRCLGLDVAGIANGYYLPGREEPEPSSVLLNGVIAALATECAIDEISGALAPVNRVIYDRGAFSITREALPQKPGCQICSKASLNRIRNVMEGEELKRLLQQDGIPCKTV